MFQVIPVIDLKNDAQNVCQVMHAKRGLRSLYAPIQSSLCSDAQPSNILAALLELYPFKTIYIADLDAICGTGNHEKLIQVIAQTYPNITFWLDCGIRQANARALYFGGNIKAVVGSENVANLTDYRAISYACESQHILSLDYNATSAMGISDLHLSARFWPDDIICMTLNAVGSGQGADIARLIELQRLNMVRKTPSRVYAAGGIRHTSDLAILASAGFSGALIATALHDGSLTKKNLLSIL